MDDRAALLARVPLFANLDDDERQRIAELADTVEVGAGTELTHEGRYEGYFFLVVSGSVRIEHGGETINTVGPGGFLGEISLIDDGPRTATAVAETPCVLLSLTNREFDEVLDRNPAIRGWLQAETNALLEQMDESTT
jgi:CRP/FNR family cyclic AMP-dependent transcriptional regulator